MNDSISPTRSLLADAIFQTVLYADIFDFPLKLDEIQRYLAGMPASTEQVADTLESSMCITGQLGRKGEFYMLPGREAIVELRSRREQASFQHWRWARRFGNLIASLPFVRMVAVTGSLAVNNLDVDGDIDYLIVTAPGRLWVCRALVILVVRLAGLRKVTLCPNYLVSENALVFTDRRLYTAHEIAQMVPLAGAAVYAQLRQLNDWIGAYLPNAQGLPPEAGLESIRDRSSWVMRLAEKLLLSPAGALLEKWESGRKIRRLNAQAGANPEVLFTADICKGHFNLHGQRLSRSLDDRLRAISERAIP